MFDSAMDGVSLDDTSSDTAVEKRYKLPGMKLCLLMFLLFIVVTSDICVNNVVSKFGTSAVAGRTLKPFGSVVLGVLYVLGFIAIISLLRSKII